MRYKKMSPVADATRKRSWVMEFRGTPSAWLESEAHVNDRQYSLADIKKAPVMHAVRSFVWRRCAGMPKALQRRLRISFPFSGYRLAYATWDVPFRSGVDAMGNPLCYTCTNIVAKHKLTPKYSILPKMYWLTDCIEAPISPNIGEFLPFLEGQTCPVQTLDSHPSGEDSAYRECNKIQLLSYTRIQTSGSWRQKKLMMTCIIGIY